MDYKSKEDGETFLFGRPRPRLLQLRSLRGQRLRQSRILRRTSDQFQQSHGHYFQKLLHFTVEAQFFLFVKWDRFFGTMSTKR